VQINGGFFKTSIDYLRSIDPLRRVTEQIIENLEISAPAAYTESNEINLFGHRSC
jgi:hypothetical protein